jgi:hypothetical protein
MHALYQRPCPLSPHSLTHQVLPRAAPQHLEAHAGRWAGMR